MMRTQISLDEALYRQARQVARQQGISFAELCRRSLADAVARRPSDQPWMVWAGTVDGREDDSASIDRVVYGRATDRADTARGSTP